MFTNWRSSVLQQDYARPPWYFVGIANMSHRNDVDTRWPTNYGDNFTTYNGINK
mgnify:CR=1 FL=1